MSARPWSKKRGLQGSWWKRRGERPETRHERGLTLGTHGVCVLGERRQSPKVHKGGSEGACLIGRTTNSHLSIGALALRAEPLLRADLYGAHAVGPNQSGTSSDRPPHTSMARHLGQASVSSLQTARRRPSSAPSGLPFGLECGGILLAPFAVPPSCQTLCEPAQGDNTEPRPPGLM